MIDATHDAAARSWVAGADGHPDFPVQNLPFGLFSPPDEAPRPGVAIGDFILDWRALTAAGLAQQTPADLGAVLATPALRRSLRRQVFRLLGDVQYRGAAEPYLHAAADCALHNPVRIGDYTDFYAGIHHAAAAGRLFRPDNPLPPNYKYVPIGYHGRASSILPSGADITRPSGQSKAPDAEAPSFGPSQRLDFELELGVWIGPGNAMGQPIPIAEAAQHIGGHALAIQGVTDMVIEAIASIAATMSEAQRSTEIIAVAVQRQSNATSEISDTVAETAAGTEVAADNVSHVAASAAETDLSAEKVHHAAAHVATQAKRLSETVDGFLRNVAQI